MKETVSILIPENKIHSRVVELAEEISRDFNGKTITLISILKGSIMLAVDLARQLHQNVEFDFMDVSSYSGFTSTGNIKINKDLSFSIEGKNVLVVEDIIDSGRTLSYLSHYLLDKKPANFKICTLLDKPIRREYDVKVDYIGFEIPDDFVIGYGLDYNEKYRNLPYIGILNIEK